MKQIAFGAVTVMLWLGVSLSAHHAYASFNRDQTVTIEGTLISLTYRNPHVMMQIRTDDGISYVTTWDSAMTLAHWSCLTASTFKVGDRLRVSGAPRLDPAQHELSLLTEVRRPSDGWDWKRKDDYPADHCRDR